MSTSGRHNNVAFYRPTCTVRPCRRQIQLTFDWQLIDPSSVDPQKVTGSNPAQDAMLPTHVLDCKPENFDYHCHNGRVLLVIAL